MTGFRIQVPVRGLLTFLLPWLLFSIGGRPAFGAADGEAIRADCAIRADYLCCLDTEDCYR